MSGEILNSTIDGILNTRLHIQNIPPHITDVHLRSLLGNVGHIKDICYFNKNKKQMNNNFANKRIYNTALITFNTHEEALNVLKNIKSLIDTSCEERSIEAKFAVPNVNNNAVIKNNMNTNFTSNSGNRSGNGGGNTSGNFQGSFSNSDNVNNHNNNSSGNMNNFNFYSNNSAAQNNFMNRNVKNKNANSVMNMSNMSNMNSMSNMNNMNNVNSMNSMNSMNNVSSMNNVNNVNTNQMNSQMLNQSPNFMVSSYSNSKNVNDVLRGEGEITPKGNNGSGSGNNNSNGNMNMSMNMNMNSMNMNNLNVNNPNMSNLNMSNHNMSNLNMSNLNMSNLNMNNPSVNSPNVNNLNMNSHNSGAVFRQNNAQIQNSNVTMYQTNDNAMDEGNENTEGLSLWEIYKDKNNNTFYYNNLTKHSQWNKPIHPNKLFQHNNNEKTKQNGPNGSNLFIFHIPSEWSDLDLFQHFCCFGNIISSKIQRDNTGRNSGFGFVSYDNIMSAHHAIQFMNGYFVNNKYLKVQLKKGEAAEKTQA
ncbi:vesicle transport v-SNARE protein VTI1, putative [Plasmodium ovale]|nr:vesicle transport v-SNARE protein VTI1, putative [Plasmodium ovale]